MKLYNNYYSSEILCRFSYFCIAFLLCFSVCYYKSNILLTFITYPYLKLNNFKRLIAININELFFISLYISNVMSLIFVFPFMSYQSSSFFCNAWFEKQISDYNTFNRWFWILFVTFSCVCYGILIPLIGEFLAELNIETHKGLLILELEPRITNYLNWVLPLLFITANMFPCTIIFMLYLLQKTNRKVLLFNLTISRKFIATLFLLFSILTIPSDFYCQLLIFFLMWGSFEFFIFCCCWYK